MTIVGCLRAGETPNSFVLANVKLDEAAMPSAKEPATAPTPPTPPTPTTPPTQPPSNPATPPTAPATPPATADPAVGTSGSMVSGDVRLIGAPANLDLSKHVGHTVAITGAWAPASKSARPTGTSGTEGAGASDAKSFNVKSMAHRSETCK